MNIYVGVPEHFADVLAEAQGKALAAQIEEACRHLHSGQSGKYAQVISLLEAMIGEGD